MMDITVEKDEKHSFFVVRIEADKSEAIYDWSGVRELQFSSARAL